MTTSLELPDPSTIPLRSPHDVLAAVPYRLGFRPTESVVLACTTAHGLLGLVARTGLDDLRGPGAAAGARTLARAVAEARPARCVLALYTADGVAAAADVLDVVLGAVEPLVDVDAWLVTPEGYRGLGCEDPTCCPDPGHPLTALDSSEVGTAHVLAGHVVASSAREAYGTPRAADEPRNLAGRAARRSEAACARAADDADRERWRDDAVATWRRALRCVDLESGPVGAAPLGPALLGKVGAALADRVVRDVALLTLLPGGEEAVRATTGADGREQADDATARAMGRVIDPEVAVAPDPEALARARAVLEQVDAHVPQRLRAPGLTLLAFLAWWAGDGPRASFRVTEALEVDEGYRLARLVHCVVSSALPPGWIRTGGGRAH
ncbi:DUF4192 domain-containing protein [Isoptericola halotolerans]|uniref:DUF4192 domain-containing protein n=1 Tax=Isoptericola halotolerans TaxID=300560 RepID=UPI00388FDE1F